MADNATPDLKDLERRIQETIESQLAHTLGQIKALQRVAQEIASTEQDVRRHRGIAVQIDSEIKAKGPEGLDIQLTAENACIERLEQIRKNLLEDLADLTKALESA